MPSSKVHSVSLRKDDTKKLEDEAKLMEAKLELLRRTLESTGDTAKGGGPEVGRWKSSSVGKPLTKGYVKGVLQSKAPARPRLQPDTTQQRSFAEAPRPGSGRASPTERAADLLPLSAAAAGGRAAANLQAHVQQQSTESLEVEAFLSGLKLDRYVGLFLEHGFDCMEVVAEMREEHMKDIGMAPGHILKLQKKLGELNPQRAAAPAPAPVPAQQGGKAARQVSFGSTEHMRSDANSKPAATTSSGGGSLLQGGFSEEESAASFQEALRAWRGGGSPKKGGAEAGGTASAPAAPAAASGSPAGAFWSSIGDLEMDLQRASTPVRSPTEPLLPEEPSAAPAAGEEKICCYQCYKQFHAKYAVEVVSELPDTGFNRVKKLCSQECADMWLAATQAKAEAFRKRQERLEKMQEMHRVLEAEQEAAREADLGVRDQVLSAAVLPQAVA